MKVFRLRFKDSYLDDYVVDKIFLTRELALVWARKYIMENSPDLVIERDTWIEEFDLIEEYPKVRDE